LSPTNPLTSSVDHWEWLATADGQRALAIAIESYAPKVSLSDVRNLNRRYGEDKAAAIASQIELGDKIAAKFDDPTRWLWTRELLEQASGQRIAEFTASLFPATPSVVDMCAGGGSDAVALANENKLELGVDITSASAAIARANLALHGSDLPVVVSAAEEWTLPPGCGVNVDPDRRDEGRRTTHLESYSPPLGFLLRLIEQTPFGSIKIAPASDWHSTILALPASETSDAEALSSKPIGLQWIGENNSVRQQRVWWGVDSVPADARTASVWIENRWQTLSRTLDECESDLEAVEFVDEPNRFLYDTDGTIRSAKLNVSLAAELNAQLLGGQHGYLTSETEIENTFCRRYHVLERSSLDVKKLRKLCRQHQIGTLTIKKRGVEVNIDRLRKDLRLEGNRAAVLILIRVEKKRFAVLCE
jgi:hypothetical protein